MGARSFQELFAWQLSADLRDRVVTLCATPPLQADRDLCCHLRRAARSAPRLIAEGFGRFGSREFRRYLTMARSELLEVQNDLDEVRRMQLIDARVVEDLRGKADQAARIVARLRSSLRGGGADTD